VPSCLEPGGVIQDVDHWARDQHTDAIVHLLGLDMDEFDIADLLREYWGRLDFDMVCAVTLELRRYGISSYQMNKWINLVRPEENLHL
jgi:hypothetical protein